MTIFGKNTIGGTSETISANNKRFCKFTSPADIGQIDSITAYLNRTLSGSGYAIRGGIYTDNAGVPANLVANSSIVISSNITRNSPQWYTANYITKPTLSPNTVYWLGIQFALAAVTYYATGTSNQEAQASDTYSDDLTSSFGSPTYHAHTMSIYASYTAGTPQTINSDTKRAITKSQQVVSDLKRAIFKLEITQSDTKRTLVKQEVISIDVARDIFKDMQMLYSIDIYIISKNQSVLDNFQSKLPLSDDVKLWPNEYALNQGINLDNNNYLSARIRFNDGWERKQKYDELMSYIKTVEIDILAGSYIKNHTCDHNKIVSSRTRCVETEIWNK